MLISNKAYLSNPLIINNHPNNWPYEHNIPLDVAIDGVRIGERDFRHLQSERSRLDNSYLAVGYSSKIRVKH